MSERMTPDRIAKLRRLEARMEALPDWSEEASELSYDYYSALPEALDEIERLQGIDQSSEHLKAKLVNQCIGILMEWDGMVDGRRKQVAQAMRGLLD